MNDSAKSTLVTLSGYAAVMVGFVSIVNLGLLADLDRIFLWGFTLTKFLTYVLLGGGVGVILSEIAFGPRQAKDFLKDTQKLAEETLGVDAKQFERTLKKGAQRLGLSERLSDQLLTVNTATGQVEYPSPAELQSRLRADFRGRVYAASTESTPDQTGVQSNLAIIPVPGTAATSDGLQKVADYLRGKTKAAIIILMILIAIFVISLVVKWMV